jgi:hypothetical protein
MFVLKRDTRLLSDGARVTVAHPLSGEAKMRLNSLTLWLGQVLSARHALDLLKQVCNDYRQIMHREQARR